MSVFVIDQNKNPLMPCSEKRAKQLLESKDAVMVRRKPAVIQLKNFSATSITGLRLKLDPGATVTGMALLDNKNNVIWLGELHHRTNIKSKLDDRRSIRRGRRSRKTRYRRARFDNRKKPEGWLAPSVQARINQVMSAVHKLQRWAPISSISMELVKFDMQKMMNPEISRVEYQQGELMGYEVRAYLQEKFNHKCVYCGLADYESKGVAFEVEHIIPRSKGGTDRVSNLAWSCEPCNKAKGTQTAAEFGHPEVMDKIKAPLKGAAAMNTIRFALLKALKETGLEVETGTGGKTSFNRKNLGLPKMHCLDAVCVGDHIPIRGCKVPKYYEVWKAIGRGSRQIMQPNAFGFPRQYRSRVKRKSGFQTGDVVKLTGGKYAGKVGRLIAKAKGPKITVGKESFSASYKAMKILNQDDGWDYSKVKVL